MVRWFYIALLSALLLACKDETRENPPLQGNYFLRANPWKFYFLDEEGKSAIAMIAGAPLPTTENGTSANYKPFYLPGHFEEGAASYSYNDGLNSVGYNAERGLYYWTTYIPGYENIKESEIYVHFSASDIDTLRVKFRFLHGDIDGGDTFVEIAELYYNNTLVIKNDGYADPAGIFIEKRK